MTKYIIPSIIEENKKSLTGRIYSREVLLEMKRQYDELIKDKKLFVTCEQPENRENVTDIDLQKGIVQGIVEKVELVQGRLEFTIQTTVQLSLIEKYLTGPEKDNTYIATNVCAIINYHNDLQAYEIVFDNDHPVEVANYVALLVVDNN